MNQSKTPNTGRKYEASWKILKSNKVIKVQVSTSTNEVVIKKHSKCFTRAIQKEKYQDIEFRREFPNALITSSLDSSIATLTLTLTTNEPCSLEDL